jgi:anti-sigma regulatory factor (Ser/Thr protein kinase)
LTVDLPPEPSSASTARAFARENLEQVCSDGTMDAVALLVTELVTNAILHARTPLQLSFEELDGRVRISVADGSPDRPVLQRSDSDAVTGRGLALVDQLSTSWGVEPTSAGKLVWCEVRC